MHGMTNSESYRDDFFTKNFGFGLLDPTTLEHEDSRRGKLFYYNGNKLCIATYNCIII